MIYEVIVTVIAEEHTAAASVYYEEEQNGLSERFLTELNSVYEKIALHPEYYGFISPKDNLRDVRLKNFPFVVIYEIKDNTVVVIDVFNTYRKPLY